MSHHSPRLPRMFWGEIIYATPGSGKTHTASKYRDVIDTDDLMVESIGELADSSFEVNDDINDPREIIDLYFRYIKFNRRRMDEVYHKTIEKMNFHCRQNDVVLLGTRDLIHLAHRAFVQENEGIVRTGFDQEKEARAIQEFNGEIHYIDTYLESCLYKVQRPRLSRMFWGEIIYATPGSGKTHTASKYRDVIDADDLMVESIGELANSFEVNDDVNDSREIICLYFHFIKFNRRRMDEVYHKTIEKMNFHCRQNDVVLLGTRDLIHLAHRAFVQENEGIVRTGFDQEKEAGAIQEFNGEIHYIDTYLESCLHKVCAGNL